MIDRSGNSLEHDLRHLPLVENHYIYEKCYVIASYAIHVSEVGLAICPDFRLGFQTSCADGYRNNKIDIVAHLGNMLACLCVRHREAATKAGTTSTATSL